MWYRNPSRREWEWYYLQKAGPPVSLSPSLWRTLLDHCEDLYIARVPLILPFVASRDEAFEVNGSLIWNGFFVRSSSPEFRIDPIPAYYRARNPDRVLQTDDDLRHYLNEAWEDAYHRWLPMSPAVS